MKIKKIGEKRFTNQFNYKGRLERNYHLIYNARYQVLSLTSVFYPIFLDDMVLLW